MHKAANRLSRRDFAKLAGITATSSISWISSARAQTGPMPLFDGKTLDGWIQIENSATSIATSGIIDPAAFAGKLANSPDGVSEFLRSRLQDPVKADLAHYPASGDQAKTVLAALVKDLNQVIGGAAIYDEARFRKVVLRPETEHLLGRDVSGQQLARLNKLLLEDAYPGELAKSVTTGWVVKDGA